MEFNSKKLERTSRVVYYAISLILCAFLILLSNQLIGDLDTATTRPEFDGFLNADAVAGLHRRQASLQAEVQRLRDRNAVVERTMLTAQQNYANEKQSFENWVKTRKTLGSPDKDAEVVSRATRLDEFYKVEQAWRAQLAARQAAIDAKARQQARLESQLERENERAGEKYEAALKRYDLKVFLIRLLFVGPVLGVGIFFFIRYRRHKFWPLYMGFTLFSLYAFFVGLVPYLPSYGGYVRSAVGVALSVGLGYYAIKTFRTYLERKQQELQASSQERAKHVQLEAAEKALENHFCPSCGKDFILKKWEFPPSGDASATYKLVTDFCRHCGLELFSNCHNCGSKNFSHLPFCATCGARPRSASPQAVGAETV
ncbi:zinc ribbon domain-containing protein [Hymenobacter armeniacus]|uniref:Zinc ribbon domain-containing protein n=1 Tax=Hymenobacter armeniacus TaxID=2771358 RepID=A0ABR8JPT0_9BACT|nr:zinc ribbon domain-containing protein [Hymenobacter armeniacus]MBD2720926.1 hypothetical protein [Hymenobacter armeniacus]